jgi:hypothetical protein
MLADQGLVSVALSMRGKDNGKEPVRITVRMDGSFSVGVAKRLSGARSDDVTL